MDDYRKSNYAINKALKGIVYRNNDGSILEVTFEKIAAENPNFTAEDFEKLKELSDELYHEEEKSDNLQAHYVKASLDELNTDKFPSNVELEENFILKEETDTYLKNFREAMDTFLTPVQKRRLYLSCFRKMTVREIAKIEGSNFTAVAKSIKLAKEKIKKFLINF